MSDARVFEVTVRVLNHSVAETPPSPGSPEYQRFSRRLLREVKLSAHAGLSSHEPAGPRSAGSGTHPRGHTAEPTAHSPRSSLDAFPLYWGTSDPGPNRLRSRWATPPDGMAGFAVTFRRGDWGSVFPLGSSFSGEALTGDRGIRPSLWPKADVSTQLGRTTLVANR